MGKGTDKLYITHSEWSSSDAYSASAGSNVSQKAPNGASFKRLPFNFCAASLQPFLNPVCTPEGTIFDVEVISEWLAKHGTNPVTGKPLKDKELIKLNFARNSDDGGVDNGKGDMVDPITFKVFTDNTHIVAIRHGSEANVFAWETIERLNVKAKMWKDLVDDREFGRSDIITLQDPQNIESRDLSKFKFIKEGETVLTKEQQEERQKGSVNIDALGRVGDKVLRAKEAVEKARREREAGGDVNRSKTLSKTGSGNTAPKPSLIQEKKLAYNAAQYTTGRAAASFTSTGLTPETSGERALLSDEEYMLRPKRVKIKGYARIETNFGALNIELQTETAPRAVWNFVQLAKKGYYNGVVFHRNIKNFMIQGGDPTGTGKGGTSIWGKNFNDEFDGPLTHDARGIMSMANKGKNTNSSQFFIIYRQAKHLDRKHTIFARVVGGLDVLQKLENVPVDSTSNRPLNDIVMEKVVVFVDPFEEFQKQKHDKDAAEKEREEIKKQGGTEDDKTTWTGKRLRADGTVVQNDQAGGVGKYLRAASEKEAVATSVDDDMQEFEPVKKKIKAGGFGNFDGW
ncbi:Cyclophilin-like protein [Glarea lozoyensis ATCC 20868]|uniref:Peptidyl-prolyl cis-trans isomerase-like 2 n=1 Tax=Glarea lozoyensis (strain ATCC 20868 / MF5171) TaxID=1116229 RepID=S3CTU8_GLAL2|nr:Cyclophilin-like protein [Glarea lozoyensis ATCC 20868]EPE29792.1 Cyclophilin-like protein [Glarea lozoyensis ATCC 20868]